MKHGIEDVVVHIRALVPSTWVQTHEEARFIRDLTQHPEIQARSQNILMWSLASGWESAGDKKTADVPKNEKPGENCPVKALRFINDTAKPGIFVLRDFHPFFNDVLVTRLYREVHKNAAKNAKAIVIVSPTNKIPPELETEISMLEYRLPTEKDLGERFQGILRQHLRTEKVNVEELARASLGLTLIQAEDAVYKSIIRSKRAPTPQMILEEKDAIVRKSGTLEFIRGHADVANVGGLRELKSWFRKRAEAYTPRAREWKLPIPKGVLLLGIPGCGKSLACKAVANLWNVPLLRLDVGKVFGSLIGESESNIRRSIAVAETVSPCILWIDEIEKGLSGTQSSGKTDGGTTARVFSSLLTWMQEKTSEVFVIATANNISQLPPELLRKGRFDEIFFVDLPSAEEREEIFQIHLAMKSSVENGLTKADIAAMANTMAAHTEGFSGAEIEQVVNDALYDAFCGKSVVTTDSMLHAATVTVPLSRTMEREIRDMREWCVSRARLASKPNKAAAIRDTGRAIEL